jgi:uncharacterized protein (DUF2147 family)
MRISIAAAALLLCSLSAGPAAAQDATGVWLSQTGETRVRIAACGAEMCGTVIWQQTPGKDVNNPDAARRDRPIVGIRMMFGMKKSGAEWNGQLYNFQDGKTYTGKMKLSGANAMELGGCVMGGLVCRTQTWTRVQ